MKLTHIFLVLLVSGLNLWLCVYIFWMIKSLKGIEKSVALGIFMVLLIFEFAHILINLIFIFRLICE